MADTQPSDAQTSVRERKRALRRSVLVRRALRSEGERRAYADRLAAAVLAHPTLTEVIARRGCVAAYVGVDDEPGTLPLLDALRERGVRVLLPVLQPDWSMRWGAYAGRAALRAAPRGLWEPEPPYADLTAADVVLVPGLAVGLDGMRLGRGGGAYDRALAALDELAGPVPRLVLLHPEEVGLDVPAEPHDLPVDGWVTG